jgi:hypothetical protein
MRIRTDGKFTHRVEEIEAAADWWGCNKSEALLRSAEFVRWLEPALRAVLERDDLTPAQKREIAATLSVGKLDILVEDTVDLDAEGNHRLRTSVTVEK